MKEYVKAVLYVYPLLKTVEKDYGDHILNKAVLSYRSSAPAVGVAEYLAEEIAEKQNLIWLRGCVESALGKLNDAERTLIAVRYFGKGRKKKEAAQDKQKSGAEPKEWSERMYFRRQNRLCLKVAELLLRFGLSEKTFEEVFAPMGIFKKTYEYLKAGKDGKLSQRERAWLGG